jgi:hypothetical protein
MAQTSERTMLHRRERRCLDVRSNAVSLNVSKAYAINSCTRGPRGQDSDNEIDQFCEDHPSQVRQPSSKAEFPSCKEKARALNQRSFAVGRKVFGRIVVYSGMDIMSKQGCGSSSFPSVVSLGMCLVFSWSYIKDQLIQKAVEYQYPQ